MNQSSLPELTAPALLTGRQPVRIGLQVDSIDPFWVEVAETIWQMSQPDGLRGNAPRIAPDVAVDELPIINLVEIELNADLLGAEEKVEEIIALGLDALISGALSMSMVHHLLDIGLPIVMLSEQALDHPRFVAPVGLKESAMMACRHLVERLDEHGRVLIVGGLVEGGNEDGRTRIDGAIEVFREYPDIEFHHLPSPWAYESACDYLAREMETMTEPFDGLFGLADTLAFAGRDVGRQFGLVTRETQVVGINGDPLAVAAIAQGEMCATVETSATALATKAVRLARLAATGEPFSGDYSYHPQLITADNVADVALRKLITIADMPSRLVGSSRRNTRQRIRQLEASLAINREIGSILDHAQLPQQIADLIRTAYGYDDVQIFLWTEGDQTLTQLQADGSELAQLRLPLTDAGALGWAFLGNHPIFVPDIQQSQRFSIDERWPATRSRVVVPLRLGGKTLGVLDLHSRTFKHHTQIELDGLQFLADQLGVAMRNARLYSDTQQALADAERANQLRTRLLANISHELREPLNVILGYSQAATATPNVYAVDLPPELQQDFHHIEQSGLHLSRVINDLIDISQAESGTLSLYPQSVETRACLTGVFDSFVASLDEDANIDASAVAWQLQLPDGLPAIAADLVRLRQILFNLLSNAAKFTDHGRVVLGARTTPTHLHIWIEDTGAGIPLDLQAHIHEAFVTAEETENALDRARSGIGLGLSMTHYLVNLHQGRLRIDSRPGLGTVCHVWLPLPAHEDTDAESPDGGRGDEEIVEQPLGALLDELLLHASELVQRTAAYIRERYDDELSRQGIANALGVSPNYISRIFRAETGLTPWQYLNRYRVAQAQTLLLESDLSVTDIAGEVGFSDPAYFSRVFRREAGKSPVAFRNQ